MYNVRAYVNIIHQKYIEISIKIITFGQESNSVHMGKTVL